ncbi:MAG: ABC transporter permease subunit [Verrucomicrobia bacterium]|nr:ABC transporter permease subunit [Verrucomicrobiota bacterium]
MNSLPVVLREMRVTARMRWIYRTRTSVALASIAAWLFVFLAAPPRVSGAEKGMGLLITLSAMAMLLALLSGVFLTADCLSQEKREGTLGLLFLTPLNGYDVVLGKMVANAASSFFALLSILPILCLPLLTGGVTWAETLRVMLALLLSLGLSLSLGMFVSVFSIESRKAFLATFLSILGLSAVPMLAWALAEAASRRVVPDSFCFQWSPIYALVFAFDFNYNRFSGVLYWRSVLFLGLIVLALLTTACRRVGSSWQSRDTSGSEPKRRAWLSRRRASLKARLKLPGLIQRGADLYAWLSYRSSAPGAGTLWFLGALTAFWFLMLMLSGTTRLRQGGFTIAMFTAFALHLIVKFMLGLEATRQIHQDVRNGNMELLLATPLPEREIVLGQTRACRRRFRGLARLLTGINVVMELSVFLFYEQLQMRSVDKVFTVFFLGGILALHLDFRAIQWVGIWKALRAQTHLRATFDTLRSVLAIPWILFPMLFFLAVQRPGGRTEDVLFVSMVAWCGFGLGLDLYLIAKTKRRLRAHFRDSAGRF